jgi:UDP-N-acetylmuramate--alanine ligase
LDELILLDIYPAREEPIPGVTSRLIFDNVSLENKTLINKELLYEELKIRDPKFLITMGAGDIGDKVQQIKNTLLELDA